MYPLIKIPEFANKNFFDFTKEEVEQYSRRTYANERNTVEKSIYGRYKMRNSGNTQKNLFGGSL